MKTNLLCGVLVAMVVAMGAGAASAGPEGRSGGGRPSFDKLIGAFDADDNGELAEDEVPTPVWLKLSNADADENGSVTREEFDSYKPSRGK